MNNRILVFNPTLVQITENHRPQTRSQTRPQTRPQPCPQTRPQTRPQIRHQPRPFSNMCVNLQMVQQVSYIKLILKIRTTFLF